MMELEAMGYTAEQAEEVDRIARSIVRTSGVSMNEVTQVICSVMRALPPLSDAEIAMIRDNPSLNIFQKWWLIHKIKNSPNCGAKMVEPQSEDKCKNCEYFHNPDYTRCHECNAESER